MLRLSFILIFFSVITQAVTDNRTYNDTHQLLSKSNRTYEYGIRGYQTKRSTSSSFSSYKINQKLSWDIDGHLMQVNNASNNKLIAKYAYDALGRRIRKQVFSNSKFAETRIYVHSGDRVADEYQARRGNRFSILRRYVYGNYVDDVVGVIYGSSSFYYYHQDRQYSSRGLTNGRGGIVESYSYTPYGKRITDSNSQANMLKQSQYGQSIGFTGRYFDSETGLYYFRARYYDTEQGRFISRDPAGYVDGMGLYNGYFAMHFAMDPLGKWLWDTCDIGDPCKIRGQHVSLNCKGSIYNCEDKLTSCTKGCLTKKKWLDLVPHTGFTRYTCQKFCELDYATCVGKK